MKNSCHLEYVWPLLSRRTVLRNGLLALGGLLCGAFPGSAKAETSRSPKARAVIQIWMSGGPPHLDTFDPKPEAGNDYCGPLNKPVETSVSGVRIGELLPLLAAQARKYTIIRSMTHGNNAHETAAYMVQTGHPSGGRLVYPTMGSVLSLFKGYEAGYKGLVPPYIVLTTPQGRFPESGFMGNRYRPFATGGDPAKTPFAVEGIVAPGISQERQTSRRELMHSLDTLHKSLSSDPQLAASQKAEEVAYDMILGDGAKAFDLSRESAEMRDRYGRNTFGQSCLAARRLVETGVPYVTIHYQGWDLHKDSFRALRRQLPEFDKGFATLLQDLSDHGLLESTIVWCGGEFGRTPKIQWEEPWNGGRGHWGKVFSAVVAGGGFKGGQVVGASDARGEEIKNRPVYPIDLIGSMYTLLGVDPDAKLPNPYGLDTRVMPAPGDDVKTGGILKEIL